MPELPEVETVRRGLERLIIGRVIKSTTHDTPKSFPNAPGDVAQFLIGATILDVRRRAKVLLIDLSTHYTLVIHLKMTGQLVFIGEEHFGAGHPNDSLIGKLPDKSTRVTFEFEDNSKLFFNDQRKFGWVKLIPTLEVPELPFMQKVGPEPLETDFTWQEFAERFKRRAKTNTKVEILDPTVVAGVGNIYADERLCGAEIHPKRQVVSITVDTLKIIYQEPR